MDIVGDLIAPDGVHVSVKTLPVRKAVFFERVALPFGERVYDLSILRLAFDIKAYRTFHAV